MQSDAATTSSRPDIAVETRGAGGKLKRPPERRITSTPYARPQDNGTQRGRWLSKLVDPARRILTGGATLIFPTLFSNPASLATLPVSSSQQHHDDLVTDVEQNANDNNDNSKLGLSNSTRVPSPKKAAERSNSSSHFERLEEGGKSDLSDDNRLSEIERLIEDKSFSRDEISRLVEIINSRAVELPHGKQEINSSSLAAEQYARGPPTDLENAGTSSKEKLEILNKSTLNTSTPCPQSPLRDEVAASPIDIARAYMEKRTSGMYHDSNNLFPKDRSEQLLSDEFALRPHSPFATPSSCWPGARVQDPRDYVTPRSQQDRFGLQSFPRTPYSRTIYSKSRSKLMQLPSDSKRQMNMSSTPLHQSQTPTIYGRSRNNDLVDGHETVGPIRRTPRRFATATRTGSSMSGPLKVENFHFSEAVFPTVKRTMEIGEKSGASKFRLPDRKPQSSEVDAAVVHPHSSQMAKKILEHLDRNPATPKDKSAEIQRIAAWKKQPSSDITAVIPKDHNGSMSLGGFDFSGNTQQVFKENSSHWSENKGDSLFKVPPPRKTYNKVTGSVKLKTSASDIKDGIAVTNHSSDSELSQEFLRSQDSCQDSQARTAAEDVSNAASSEVLNLGKSTSQPSTAGSKPVLPSISVTKPEQRWMLASDNSSGFTFPVSSSHGTVSEPPTPSVMPLSTASGQLLPKAESSVPSYSFGTKKSGPALVFSFPSTSNAATGHDLCPNLQFNFGSEKPARLSFSSFGKDAVCH